MKYTLPTFTLPAAPKISQTDWDKIWKPRKKKDKPSKKGK